MPFSDLSIDAILFGHWQGSWLASSAFKQLTIGLSIWLSLGTSALLLLEQRARRLSRPFPARLMRRVWIALTLISFLLYYDFFNPNTRYNNYYHRHEFFHYYLGSKYFDEVGYNRLYTCTAVAEVEAGRGEHIRRQEIRELGARNLLIPMTETYVFSDPGRCKRHFSPERWRAFSADVAWFERSARGDYWDRMKIDHGYNPPPVWTMTGEALASLAPASDGFFKLLAGIDVLLQLGSLLCIGWAFGLRCMAIAAVFWGCNYPADFHYTGGAFLRQDWYFLFIASLCLARKRHFALSGAALTWSTALRIFPVVTFVGAAFVIGFDVLAKRRLRSSYRNFILGSALWGAFLFCASSAVSGVGSYAAFVDHIRLHKGTPLTNNMGLEMLLAYDWDNRMVFTIDRRLDDEVLVWKQLYTARVHALRPLALAVAAVVLAWLGWASRHTRLLWVGMALTLPVSMSLLNLTCYYYCLFIAAALLCVANPALAPAYLALAGASQVLGTRFYWIDDEYTALSLLYYAFALSILYAFSRPPNASALLAKLRGWAVRAVRRAPGAGPPAP